jgi:sRNA-binding regulator protein Hfq
VSENNPDEQQPQPPRLPGHWGLNSAPFFNGRREPPMKVALLDGQLLSGVRVGVDPYNVFLRQTSDLGVMIPKHAVKYGHAAPPQVKE